MRLKNKNNWFKDLFKGFFDNWSQKIIVGIMATVLGTLLLTLFSFAWEVFLLIAFFFAVAYTVGHFIMRES